MAASFSARPTHSSMSLSEEESSDTMGTECDENRPLSVFRRVDTATGAHPQWVARGDDAEPIWPPSWGISIDQCRALMEEVKRDPKWNSDNTVYTLVQNYIIPKTRGTGLGYALLLNRDEPKEVTVMISHAWGENAEEFFDTLERSVGSEDVVFVCALSLYQCGDGQGPTIEEQLGQRAEESPFRKVLDHLSVRFKSVGGISAPTCRMLAKNVPRFFLVLAVCLFFFPMGYGDCIPTLHGCARGVFVMPDHPIYIGQKCMFPKWNFTYDGPDQSLHIFLPLTIASLVMVCLTKLLFSRFGPGGCMLAVPNRECDLYSRLWCCYEIFVAVKLGVPVELAKTLAPAGHNTVRKASCSNQDDKDRIFREIEGWQLAMGTQQRVHATLSRLATIVRENTKGSDNDWAFDRVDKAIRVTTQRALRSANLAIFFWILPFLLMSLACPEGDWMAQPEEHLFKSPMCTGIYSMALAGVLLQAMIFGAARRLQGNIPYLTAIAAAVGVLAVGVGLRSFDFQQDGVKGGMFGPGSWQPTRYPPFHHCFTLGLISGGISMLALAFFEWLSGGKFISFPYRRSVLLVIAPLILFAMVWHSAASSSFEQVYPTAIWYLSFRFAPFFGYPAMLWSAAAHWGVRFGTFNVTRKTLSEKFFSNLSASETSSGEIAP